RIHAGRRGIGSRYGSNLRPERQLTISQPVVHQLDAHRIARDDEPLAAHVPDRHPEHAVEMVEDVRAPFLVALDDDFPTGARLKAMTALFELGAQFFEVVDLAVEDDPDALLRV